MNLDSRPLAYNFLVENGVPIKPRKRLKVKKLVIDSSPTDLFLRVKDEHEYAFLLESMTGPEKLAQFSFIGFDPELIVSSKESRLKLETKDSNKDFRFDVSDPIDVLKEIIVDDPYDEGFRFTGGAVGYFSYDVVRHWEKLPSLQVDDLNFPDLEMGVYNDCVLFDHVHRQAYYLYRGEDRSNEFLGLCQEPMDSGKLSFSTPKVNVKQDHYQKKVEKAKEYIASGDIFQVVLSNRHEFKVKGSLDQFYLALRKINPSPYMYFLKLGERRIIGSSPEMLVRVEERRVETYPIAGTCPRVENPAENQALAEELVSDPKERAEHVMLVDLGRNDIGKVSRFGSVQVPEFMEVHQYSHVQHLVSRVVGELRDECDCYDALRAVFPAGTVSGAPKVRAMEIIEESEPTKRGPYAGAVGYFSFNGNSDFAITIRTLVAEGEKCSIQVGGGIVADSVPEKEWYETKHKAKALFKALELSEG